LQGGSLGAGGWTDPSLLPHAARRGECQGLGGSLLPLAGEGARRADEGLLLLSPKSTAKSEAPHPNPLPQAGEGVWCAEGAIYAARTPPPSSPPAATDAAAGAPPPWSAWAHSRRSTPPRPR